MAGLGHTTFWTADAPLVLASTSRTRCEIIESAGIPTEACQHGISEREIEAPFKEAGKSIRDLALLLAREKALAVSRHKPERLVLGADQTLECDNRQFHKPDDIMSAREHLLALLGKTHYLHSAIALAINGEVIFETTSTADLCMRSLSDNFIDQYIQLMGDCILSSVGGYQIEGLGIQLFSSIEGDYFTILGLPLFPLLDFLRQQGYLIR